MSADDNLRDALIEAFKQGQARADANEPDAPELAWGDYGYGGHVDPEACADIAIKVIKDWTADDWRPIETCPQDGFFLVHEGGAVRSLLRSDGKWLQPGVPVMVTEYGDRLTSPETDRAYGRKLEISDCIYEPTHWMPIPEAPKS